MLGKRIINTATGAACTTDTVQILGDTSCVAYYKMSDATDQTGSYDGAATNVNFNVAGKFGNAAQFNGSSSKITLPNSTTNSIDSNGAFSVSFWFFANSGSLGSTERRMITLFDGLYIWIEIPANEFLRYRVTSSSSTYIENTGTTTITENAWHHIILTGDSTNGIIAYLNGSVEILSASWDGTFKNGSGASRYDFNVFGGQEDNLGSLVRPFLGKIDQVRIFDRAITSDEVTTLYNEVYCQPTIVPTDHFEVALYDGNSGTNEISSLDFKPDLVYTKWRSGSVQRNSCIYDSVRGVGDILVSEENYQSGYISNTLTSFDDDGFTLGNWVGNNQTGNKWVAWNWKAGGTAVSNTDGTITSQVSANTDAGFSIISYTGNGVIPSTYGHGLSKTPEIVLVKNRDASSNWTFNSNLTPTGAIFGHLNTTAGLSQSTWMGGTDSVVSMLFENGNLQNANGNDYIAYAFHSVEGYSKIGSYVGTGASGNSIVTGFRPAFVMTKKTNNTGSWTIIDNKRDSSNPIEKFLKANDSTSEGTASDYADFNSNGFTLNTSSGNNSGDTFIYLAFAEENVQPEPELANSFNVVTYTGNGSTQAVTGLGFQPDFVWIRERTTVEGYRLYDSVRGVTKHLNTTNTAAEAVNSAGLTSFDSNGFSVGSYAPVNTNNEDYVAWAWKASNDSTINNDGSISSVVSANPASGFSVVKYTGTNSADDVGHGLSSTPELVIAKTLDSSDSNSNWIVASTLLSGQRGILNGTQSFASSTTHFRADATSTVLRLSDNSSSNVNRNGDDHIAYCFHSVDGYQKVGSYTGTTAAKQVDVGFQPRFVMIKNSSRSPEQWFMVDSLRTGTYSPILHPNQNFAETQNVAEDVNFNSNGFLLDTTAVASAGLNENGDTYIYLAIA